MHHVVFDMMGVIYEEGWFVSRGLGVQLADVIELEALRERYRRFATGKSTRDEFWNGLATNAEGADRELLDGLTVNPSLDAIRERLGRGRCSLLSEIPTPWGKYLLERAGLRNVFRPEVLSGTAGCTKPGAEIFQYLLDRLDADPRSEPVFFLDDKLENLQAGARFGLRTIWYRRQEPDADFEAEHVIESLEELLQIPGMT